MEWRYDNFTINGKILTQDEQRLVYKHYKRQETLYNLYWEFRFFAENGDFFPDNVVVNEKLIDKFWKTMVDDDKIYNDYGEQERQRDYRDATSTEVVTVTNYCDDYLVKAFLDEYVDGDGRLKEV